MKDVISVVVVVVFLTFIGWSFMHLFKELATVRPNVERILLNK